MKERTGEGSRKTVHTVVEVFDCFNLQNNIMASLFFQARRTILLYEPGQKEAVEGVCAFLQTKVAGLALDIVQVGVREARQVLGELFQKLHKEGQNVLVEMNGGSPVISNYARECCMEYAFPCIVLDAIGGQIINVVHADSLEGSFTFPKLTFSDILLLQGRVYNRNMHMLAEESFFPQILAMSEYAFANQADFKFFYDFVHHKSDGVLSEPGLKIVLKKAREVSDRIILIFSLFEKHGFIQDFYMNDYEIVFTCTAPFVKEMLAVKGSWLELYVYILARESGLFSEVYQSVMIGWDLKRRPKFNVENEIDVVLMKQGTPVFMSCKMTNPKPDDLNEIYALADSFGGYGAVPALVTSYHVRKRNVTLWNRAREMGVLLLDYEDLNRKSLMEIFRELP